MSILHVVYLTCIKPYITQNSVVLEIGPGRGAWTKTFLSAKEVWCLDALSAEHNNFWQYVGHSPNVRYIQVSDFSCSMLPDSKFDYLFSFGSLCHISFEGIGEYMKNLRPKLKRGAHCFVMIADYEKYNMALDNRDKLSIFNVFAPHSRSNSVKWALATTFSKLVRLVCSRYIGTPGTRKSIIEDNIPTPGRWYHAGIEKTCEMLQGLGYQIVDPDMGVVHRDPIIHFTT